MRPQTANLKKQLQKAKSIQEKLDLLKDSYKDEVCYILTAGPSIGDFAENELYEKLSDKLVISIKQTVELVKAAADFHLINEYNYQKYNLEPNTIKVKLKTSRQIFTPFYDPDISFSLDKEMRKEGKILAETRKFEKYTFENNLKRPLGSGIMYELGIYLPIWLGVKKLVIIGWDIGNAGNDQITRFYENDLAWHKKFEKKFITKNPNLYNNYYMKGLNFIKLFLFPFLNAPINIPGVRKNESSIIAESTAEFYKWFQQKGIDVEIVSNRSLCSDLIPRREL